MLASSHHPPFQENGNFKKVFIFCIRLFLHFALRSLRKSYFLLYTYFKSLFNFVFLYVSGKTLSHFTETVEKYPRHEVSHSFFLQFFKKSVNITNTSNT